MGYLIKSSAYQLQLLKKREKLEKALKDPHLDEETKRKIRLVQEVKKFAEAKLSLIETKNYDSFVLLDDRYVVYAVTASLKNKLEPYTWSFPIVGKVPYKGFFKKPDALDEKTELEKENLDVMVRGVSAYSTLGWFSDPLLSSMTAYEDESLVDTIIHETTHATVYIKSNADFNERLATFVGNKGMEQFYFEKEGAESQAVKRARKTSEDSKTFSLFITEKIKALEAFYKEHEKDPDIIQKRSNEFAKIKSDFTKECLPKLQTPTYKDFANQPLNNALLISYKTYYQDLSAFDKAFIKAGNSWPGFMNFIKGLKKSGDPEKDLRDFISKI